MALSLPRSRSLALALTFAATIGLGVVGCTNPSRPGAASRPHRSESAASATTVATPLTTVRRSDLRVDPPAVAPRSIAVELTLVDETRPTVSHGATVATSRTLPTSVWMPADAGGNATGRRLPWLIFLHGFNVEPSTYTRMIDHWARAGYAVVAPTLPLTSSQSGAVLDEADMVNEPGDVSFLITSLLARSDATSGPLSGRLDPQRIGVAGHSDGANVAFASGYSTTLGDPRIKAVVDASGELPTGMGPYPTGMNGPPLLLIASDADEFVRPHQTQALYDTVEVPRWWVELHGAAHLPPFSEANDWSTVVDQVTVDFLDVALGGYDVDPSTIAADAQQPPTATLAASAPT